MIVSFLKLSWNLVKSLQLLTISTFLISLIKKFEQTILRRTMVLYLLQRRHKYCIYSSIFAKTPKYFLTSKYLNCDPGLYSVPILENTDQKKLHIWSLFTKWELQFFTLTVAICHNFRVRRLPLIKTVHEKCIDCKTCTRS